MNLIWKKGRRMSKMKVKSMGPMRFHLLRVVVKVEVECATKRGVIFIVKVK